MGLMASFLWMTATALSAETTRGFTGRWEITTDYPGGSFTAGLELSSVGQGYEGHSAYLVPDDYWYQYAGSADRDRLRLKILAPDGKSAIGELTLTLRGDKLMGNGVLHDVPISVSAHRPLTPPAGSPRTHDFKPQLFYRAFSGALPPALHIFPGDTVRTQTVDAAGGGVNKEQHTLGGNPQTGPFYIEGAMVGDTIVVHFNKIRLNRDTAFQVRSGLNPRALPSGYPQSRMADTSDVWNLDREHLTATPANPSSKLKGVVIKLTPMLGCVSVAPFWNQTIATSDSGPFGGNLDYNQVREGTTLYLPVYRAGALLSIGDGHAVQGDGEITGQGLETSMDVEFTVGLIRDQLLDQPWAENAESIMVSGVGGSLEAALQTATAGLSNWLKSYYDLDASEVATVLANAIHYDIAEIVDPQVHVVARIPKDALAQLPKPPGPKSMFCQASWGCVLTR
jgi:acetamidase/formamidase